MIGKKAQGGDYLAFVVFCIGLGLLFVLIFLIITPKIGGKSDYEIKVEMGQLSQNLFLYGYLRQTYGSQTMTDIIANNHAKQQYHDLGSKTIDILRDVQEDVNYRIYINSDKVLQKCSTSCSGDEREFSTTLPTAHKEIIEFKLVLYEPK